MRTVTFIFIISTILITSNFSAQQINKYEPVEGKIVGIWPHNNRLKSVEKLKELKERWGFNYLLLAAIYGEREKEIAREAGFDSLHIAFQIHLPDLTNNREAFLSNIESLGKIYAFYFDEPISRKHSYMDFLKLIKYLSDNGYYPHAKFLISELDEKKAGEALGLVDEVLYSGYGSKDKFGLDQVKTWNEWRSYLGEKFSSSWIGAHEDYNEYDLLFKTAKELNFNSIWFYQLEPLDEDKETDDTNFQKFCEAAVKYGFLKRKE